MDINTGLKYDIIQIPEIKPVGRNLLLGFFSAICITLLLSIVSGVSLMIFSSIDEKTPAISIMGGADGPTSVFITKDPNSVAIAGVFFGVFCVLFFLSLIGYAILHCIVLYRGWSVLQPLRIINSRETWEIPSAGSAVGLMFVPYFALYWQFPAYMRLARYGEMMAQFRGKTYKGPATSLSQVYCIINLITYLLLFTLPVSFIMGFKVILDINEMIREFGPSYKVDLRQNCV